MVANRPLTDHTQPCRGDIIILPADNIAPTGLAVLFESVLCYQNDAPTELDSAIAGVISGDE